MRTFPGLGLRVLPSGRKGYVVQYRAERDSGRKAITVKELADRFDRKHISLRVKPSTAKEYRRNLERFILHALGRLTVTGITRADVAKFHHDLRNIP